MTQTSPRQPVMGELPTQEATAHGAYRVEHTSPKPGALQRLRRMDGSELDRLLMLGWLEPEDHAVLARFQADLHAGGLVFSVRSSIHPSSTVGGGERIADAAFLRSKRIADQQRALAEGLYETEHRLVLAVLTSDQPMSKDGVKILKKASVILAGVYGV